MKFGYFPHSTLNTFRDENTSDVAAHLQSVNVSVIGLYNVNE